MNCSNPNCKKELNPKSINVDDYPWKIGTNVYCSLDCLKTNKEQLKKKLDELEEEIFGIDRTDGEKKGGWYKDSTSV